MVKKMGKPKKPKAPKPKLTQSFSISTVSKHFAILSALIGMALVASLIIFVADNNSETAKQDKQAACLILTNKVATSAIGESKKVDEKSGSSEANGVITATCLYKQTGPTANGQQITLTVRTPRSDEGVTSNKDYFKKEKFGTSKKLPVYEKYGDKATWDAPAGQLNILKGDVWYTLTVGGNNASDRQLNSAGRFAEQIKDKL